MNSKFPSRTSVRYPFQKISTMTRLRKKNIDTRAFSLIELMVSLTIFAIVMLVCTSTLLTLIDANAKAQALNTAMTNLSYALDSMTREIRTGYHFYCSDIIDSTHMPDSNETNDCVDGHAIRFYRDRDSKEMFFKKNGEVIEQKLGSGAWQPLTANDVKINKFELTVSNTDSYYGDSDLKQPTVDVEIGGYIENGLNASTTFSIQTHMVQRRIDIY